MRHNNWQNRLSGVINNAHKPFDFVEHNCLFLALQNLDAMLETRHYNKYKSYAKDGPEAAAIKLRKVDKVKTCQELLQKLVSNPELQHISAARPGDIVFIEHNRESLPVTQVELFGPTPGVCYGLISYFVGENDLIEIPTLTLDSALWVS
jgi:hypothetical protein